MTPGCNSELSSQPNVRINTSKTIIEASETNSTGYEIPYCLKCDVIQDQSLTKDGLRIIG